MFKLLKKSNKSRARLGILKTAHGSIKTPFFMPCATQGAVKTISIQEIKKLKSQILLSNTYHLMLRPGEKLIKKSGGLHKFMNWDKPILTDSGGFQVFSLAGTKNKSGKGLVKLTKNGVKFKSYINGQEFYLTPEKALKIQMDLGVDIAVALDVCSALPSSKEDIKDAVELTSHWAKKIFKSYVKISKTSDNCKMPLLFPVIQGGLNKNLRLKSLSDIIEINSCANNFSWGGYNIGGLSVGETAEEMYEVLDYLCPEIPENKPRYLMGVGYPDNIVEAVKRGVDMFDCVIPTREGRHGRLFVWTKKINFKNSYKAINVNCSKFKKDFSPINSNSKLAELREYSLAYLHYLFKIKEPLGQRLASLNNLEFYLDLMGKIRYNIKENKL